MFLLHLAQLWFISYAVAQLPTCRVDDKGQNISTEQCQVDRQEYDCSAGGRLKGLLSLTLYQDQGVTCPSNRVVYSRCYVVPSSYTCETYRQAIEKRNNYKAKVGYDVAYDKCIRNVSGGVVTQNYAFTMSCSEDCETDPVLACQQCHAEDEMCGDLECPEDSSNPDCLFCKGCEPCKPFVDACPVNCESELAQDCLNCNAISEECDRDCKDDMDSDECFVCKMCRACKPFKECKAMEKPDGSDLDKFCEDRKDAVKSCMACTKCLPCLNDEMRSSQQCVTCQDCQECSPLKMCMTGGLEMCKAEKIGPVMFQHLDRLKVKECFDMFNQPADDKLTKDECDCITPIPEDVVKENDCFHQVESVGDMRKTCEASKVPNCGDIDEKKDCKELQPACKWKKNKCRKKKAKVVCKKLDRDACDANESCESDVKKGKSVCIKKKKKKN